MCCSHCNTVCLNVYKEVYMCLYISVCVYVLVVLVNILQQRKRFLNVSYTHKLSLSPPLNLSIISQALKYAGNKALKYAGF